MKFFVRATADFFGEFFFLQLDNSTSTFLKRGIFLYNCYTCSLSLQGYLHLLHLLSLSATQNPKYITSESTQLTLDSDSESWLLTLTLKVKFLTLTLRGNWNKCTFHCYTCSFCKARLHRLRSTPTPATPADVYNICFTNNHYNPSNRASMATYGVNRSVSSAGGM